MPSTKIRLYRVSFHNRGQIYEIYAHEVSHGAMLGFIEIGRLVFGEKSSVVVDPGEEKLKNEFQGVDRFFVPVHSVIRIDVVHKQGAARIHPADGDSAGKTPVYNFSDYKK